MNRKNSFSSLKKKKILTFIIRWSLSLGILLIIIYRINWETISENFYYANKYYLILAIFALIFEMFLKSYKWYLLLEIIKIKISFLKVLEAYYISNFLGFFMPSSLGIDVLRTYCISKYAEDTYGSFFSVFIDRAFGIISLSMVMIYGLFSSSASFIENRMQLIFVGLLMFFLFSMLIIYFDAVLKMINSLLKRWKNNKFTKLSSMLDISIDYMKSIKRDRKRLLWFFIITVFFQINRIVIAYLVALSLNIHIMFGYWVVIVMVVIILSMLPFSVAGLGVREGAYVFLLGKLGVPMSKAFLLSIVMFFLGIFVTLPGMFIYLRRGISPQKLKGSHY